MEVEQLWIAFGKGKNLDGFLFTASSRLWDQEQEPSHLFILSQAVIQYLPLLGKGRNHVGKHEMSSLMQRKFSVG